MKIVFDQGVPAPLRDFFMSHQVSTAYELKWDTLKNGELITAAEVHHFDVLLSTDQNLKYQQKLDGRKIAIAVLLSTSWPKIQLKISSVILQWKAFSKVSRLKSLFERCGDCSHK